MTLNQRYKSALLSIVAVIAATCSSEALWAQNCGDLPPQSRVGQQRLAVKLSGSWKIFTPNSTEPAYVISIARAQKLCLAWEAPPYPYFKRQIVYASTQYREDQPIWLWRNNALSLPIIDVLLGNWSKKPDSSGRDPVEAFTAFHRSLPKNLAVAPWKDLKKWHDTSAWFPNQESYAVVSTALEDTMGSLPQGTERLLLLKANRSLTSWILFTTHVLPSRQDHLLVAVAFSGDLDEEGPRVYRYTFEVR